MHKNKQFFSIINPRSVAGPTKHLDTEIRSWTDPYFSGKKTLSNTLPPLKEMVTGSTVLTQIAADVNEFLLKFGENKE